MAVAAALVGFVALALLAATMTTGSSRPHLAVVPNPAQVPAERPATSAAPTPSTTAPPTSTTAVRAGPTPDEEAIAPPPETFDGPPPEPTAPPPSLRAAGADGQGTGVWAVVIGIDDYPGSGSDLRSAVADAHEVDRVLSTFGVPSNQRLVLTDQQVTADVVLQAADWLVSNAGPEATAVFFYAGHIRKVGASTEAIVAADGGTVRDTQLAARLAPLAARHAWFALAGCYAGGFTELTGPGRVLTAAAGADQLAYENTALGRSYLVEYVVRRAMLLGGESEVEDAFTAGVAELRRDRPDRLPVQFDDVAGTISLRQPGTEPSPTRLPPEPPPAPAEDRPPPPPPTTAPPRSTPPSEPDEDEDEDDGGDRCLLIFRC